MQLRRARTAVVLLGILHAGCDNKPGEIRVVNAYTGSCPLYFKTSEYRGIEWATTPLLPGENNLPPLRPGLLRVDFRTEGIACGPEPCSLGPSGFESSCAFFSGARLPATIVVRDSPGTCNQPLIVCPDLASLAPDASATKAIPADASPASGTWIVTVADPASGIGTVGITSVGTISTSGGDPTLQRIVVNGLVGTTKHVLTVEVAIASGNVTTISHAWTPADGVDAGLALCSTAAPWPPCAGAAYSTARNTLTLAGTQLGNPVLGNGASTIDAVIAVP